MQMHYCYMVAKKVRRLDGLQTARKLQPSINRLDSTDKCTKIKMIDMREEWVELLRNRTLLQTAKVPGPENEADFFTKILPEPAFRAAEEYRMMKKIK